MSEFSNILSKYIHEKKIKTFALAQYCELDRSNMYKIINGKRKPTSIELVKKFSQFLHLSPAEENELIESYHISIIGHENYFRRKAILDFFSEFHLTTSDNNSFNYEIDLSINEDLIPLNTLSTVRRALFHIVTSEMSKKQNGYMLLLIQPDNDFLFNLINIEGQVSRDITIEQIICFNNSTDVIESKRNYNINCLKQILPLYGSFQDYKCYYYYDNIMSRTSKMSLFPYMVITSTAVCLLTSDINKGYIVKSKDSIQMFTDIFYDYRKSATILLNPIKDILMNLDYINSHFQEREASYSFQMTPCFTPFITSLHLKKYLKKNLSNRDEFINRFQSFLQESKRLYNQGHISCIFSFEGVKNFFISGKISEYPPDVYDSFDVNDRIMVIRNLINACNSMHYRMLKKSIGNLNNELFLFINPYNGYLMFLSPHTHKPVYLNIEEPGLLFSFYDFCENLKDDLFYTPDETIAKLKALINN